MQQGLVKVPGSCGELVQGTIKGIDFLVSCPVNIYSQVRVTLNGSPRLTAVAGKSKALLAVERTQEYLGIKQGGEILVESQLPLGKGMASSTADISAACWATAAALGKELTAKEVACLALSIEPSDGLMFPGITMFDHVRGRISKFLGSAPVLGILVLDLGGEVDTLHFNQREDLVQLNREKEPQVLQALQLVERGIQENNLALIGEGATLSALAHQKILPKPDLPEIVAQVQELGALGVNVAHSGTVIGILVEPEKIQDQYFQEIIEKKLGRKLIASCQLVDGGRV